MQLEKVGADWDVTVGAKKADRRLEAARSLLSDGDDEIFKAFW